MNLSPTRTGLGVIASPSSKTESRACPKRREILGLLERHGLVVLRGFDVGVDAFEDLTRTVAGGVSRGVVETENALEFHGELYYLPWRPDVLWFYCRTPSTEGGETTFCDGVRVARELSAASRAFFEATPLQYEFSLSKKEFQRFIPLPLCASRMALAPLGATIEDRAGDALLVTYASSAFRKTRWGGETAFINLLLHACDPVMAPRQSYRFVTSVPDAVLADVRATTARLTYAHAWESRDVVAVDNSRVMHGRRPFRGTREMMAVNGKLFGPGRALQRLITGKEAPPVPWREIASIR